MWVDGEPVAPPGEPPSASDLLSAELDQFGRDRVYEAAVKAVSLQCSRSAAAVRLARPAPNVVTTPRARSGSRLG